MRSRQRLSADGMHQKTTQFQGTLPGTGAASVGGGDAGFLIKAAEPDQGQILRLENGRLSGRRPWPGVDCRSGYIRVERRFL
jgi:hypothetical protein